MSFVRDRFHALLEHRLVDGDTENNAIVGAIADGLADAFDRVGLIAFGDEAAGIDGARVLKDPNVAPLWALAHAALYTGAQLPGRMTDESDANYLLRARDAAVYPFGIKRGTHEAVRRAVAPFLTGSKTVFISDNYGDVYGMFVRTLTEETPDQTKVRAALEGDFVSGGLPGAIRAELKLTYTAANYPAWAEGTLRWNQVAGTVTWANARREDV